MSNFQEFIIFSAIKQMLYLIWYLKFRSLAGAFVVLRHISFKHKKGAISMIDQNMNVRGQVTSKTYVR